MIQQWMLTKPGSLLGVQRAHQRVVGVAASAASAAPGVVLVDGEGEHGKGHGQPGRDRRAQADRREQDLERERQAGGWVCIKFYSNMSKICSDSLFF